MDIITMVVLGVVQGITEFLPISSTAHLILMREFLSLSEANSLAIDGILHLATTTAIIIYFWNDLWVLIQTAIRKLGRQPVNKKDLTLLYALLVGTIPAVILGIFLEPIMTAYLQSPLIVSGALFLSAVFFMYAEWRYYTNPPHGSLTIRKGFLVGCFQAVALIPGISRSGTTLAGGMLLGMTRTESARFSFLLAIPITLAVGLKKLLELMVLGGEVAWLGIMIGAGVSFLVALLMIHFFLAFIRRHTLWPFVWYLIVLSLLVTYYSLYL